MEKVDRRIRITQEKIKNSFWDLMQSNTFQDISVSKLASTADINRTTFYTHYTDKYDLLLEIIHELLDFSLIMREDLEEDLATYFERLSENSDCLRVLFKDQSMVFFKEDIKTVWRNHFPVEFRKTHSFKLGIMTSILMESIEWWITDGKAVSNEKMAQRVIKLMDVVVNIDNHK